METKIKLMSNPTGKSNLLNRSPSGETLLLHQSQLLIWANSKPLVITRVSPERLLLLAFDLKCFGYLFFPVTFEKYSVFSHVRLGSTAHSGTLKFLFYVFRAAVLQYEAKTSKQWHKQTGIYCTVSCLKKKKIFTFTSLIKKVFIFPFRFFLTVRETLYYKL